MALYPSEKIGGGTENRTQLFEKTWTVNNTTLQGWGENCTVSITPYKDIEIIVILELPSDSSRILYYSSRHNIASAKVYAGTKRIEFHHNVYRLLNDDWDIRICAEFDIQNNNAVLAYANYFVANSSKVRNATMIVYGIN